MDGADNSVDDFKDDGGGGRGAADEDDSDGDWDLEDGDE